MVKSQIREHIQSELKKVPQVGGGSSMLDKKRKKPAQEQWVVIWESCLWDTHDKRERPGAPTNKSSLGTYTHACVSFLIIESKFLRLRSNP